MTTSVVMIRDIRTPWKRTVPTTMATIMVIAKGMARGMIPDIVRVRSLNEH